MKIEPNKRGFAVGKFKDLSGAECSIQKSSNAGVDAIWIGIDKPTLIVFENESKGKYIETTMPPIFMVNARMQLSREQVAVLIPALQAFVETGEI